MCQVPQTLEATLVTTLATLDVASAAPGSIPLHRRFDCTVGSVVMPE